MLQQAFDNLMTFSMFRIANMLATRVFFYLTVASCRFRRKIKKLHVCNRWSLWLWWWWWLLFGNLDSVNCVCIYMYLLSPSKERVPPTPHPTGQAGRKLTTHQSAPKQSIARLTGSLPSKHVRLGRHLLLI